MGARKSLVETDRGLGRACPSIWASRRRLIEVEPRRRARQ